MSPASHMVGRLRELHGTVLGKMRFLNERRANPRCGHWGPAPRNVMEQLEPRLLLDGISQEQALELFSVSPALFVENQGQWADTSVRYAHNGSGANVAMTDAGPVFQVFRQEPREGAADAAEDGLAAGAGRHKMVLAANLPASEVTGGLVALLVFKTSVGLNKVPGGFDSHSPPCCGGRQAADTIQEP